MTSQVRRPQRVLLIAGVDSRAEHSPWKRSESRPSQPPRRLNVRPFRGSATEIPHAGRRFVQYGYLWLERSTE